MEDSVKQRRESSRDTQVSLPVQFSADRPISCLKEDQLGRGDFAIALTNALVQWKGHDSLVAALYGDWGSGKTSIKNVILGLLAKAKPKYQVVEFNPWRWSGDTEKLLFAFFEEVAAAIG